MYFENDNTMALKYLLKTGWTKKLNVIEIKQRDMELSSSERNKHCSRISPRIILKYKADQVSREKKT